MVLALFGSSVDLHAGGGDLEYPHHACEAALAEATTGVTPFARAWLRAGIVSIDTHGKHLFLRFDNGLTIHSHLRMSGRWRIFERGFDWGRRARAAWLVLRAGSRVVVQFNGPILELMRDSRLRYDPADVVAQQEGWAW